jgi:YidC/Oxa1 family membrane protein insertase
MLPQDQESQKNLLLAIVLSVAVLLAWQFFYAGPKLKEEQERQARIRQEQQAKAKDQQAPPSGAPAATPDVSGRPGTVPGPSSVTIAANRQAALGASPRVAIETPSIKGSISLKGGRIDDVVLTKYRETVESGSPNVVLFSPSGAPHPYYAEYGWVAGAGSTQPLPNQDTLWLAERDGPLTPSSPVTLVWDNGQGLIFRRTIGVDENYLFTVSDEVENKTGAPVALHPYALISRHGMPKIEGYYILHEGPIGVLGSVGLQELSYADLLKEGGSKSYKQTGGWLGFTDKYWAAALLPEQTAAYEARFSGTKGGKDTFQADFVSGPVTIAPGAKQSILSHLFAGAKVVNLIDAYGVKLGVPRFELIIDWGWFYFITKPLFKLLHWLGLFFGNYGLAILATTVLVKLVFFPLANKSYESMAKMKMLQPEMEKLRERYKDDRTRQQQELMQLYRDRKINPMAGCLPIVVQIPVFFALYKVLFITIDMRHAPFYGWIKDLSAPDPTSVFNLFGLLPYAVPEFLHVGVWPIIMGITMWVQMQLNPQQPDPVQQKIFNWMPVLFTFLLASFSVGLVIYWAWNNVLSLIQQYTIMRKNGAEIHLWKNIGLDKLAERLKSGQGLGFAEAVARGSASVRRGAETLGERAGVLKRSDKPEGTREARSKDAADGGRQDAASSAGSMTREQALAALGLEPGATPTEIDAAYNKHARKNGSLNGSEKLSEARDVLRGKEGA